MLLKKCPILIKTIVGMLKGRKLQGRPKKESACKNCNIMMIVSIQFTRIEHNSSYVLCRYRASFLQRREIWNPMIPKLSQRFMQQATGSWDIINDEQETRQIPALAVRISPVKFATHLFHLIIPIRITPLSSQAAMTRSLRRSFTTIYLPSPIHPHRNHTI